MTTGSIRPRCKTNSVTKSMRRLMKGISSWDNLTTFEIALTSAVVPCVLRYNNKWSLLGTHECKHLYGMRNVSIREDGIKAEAGWRPYPPTCVLSNYRRERVKTASRLVQIYRDLLLKSPTVLMGPQFLFKTMKDAGIGILDKWTKRRTRRRVGEKKLC
ncbi:hypothetical protein V1477_003486 [Vespula maculifrons]|uniref:Uncharacterized protein n=1 Tax=Vespula maculifrons TaxID=7453 RepID=A0ABD2CT78_VESMC